VLHQPLSPPAQHPLERDGRACNLRERETRASTAHHEIQRSDKLSPSSNISQTLLSACFSSPSSYSRKPCRLFCVYTIVYCLYTRLLVRSGSLTSSSSRVHCLLRLLSRASSFIPRTETLSASEHSYLNQSILMTPSNATSAIAFAGNALKKHGTKPLQ
jgi:hypothetical protein